MRLPRSLRPVALVAALALASSAATAGDGPVVPVAPPAAPAPKERKEGTGDVDAQVTRLLADVASDDFAVREKARASLAALGPDARHALEARREDKDPEIRRTVATLLDAMGGAESALEPAADVATLDLVTLSGEGPLVDVLHTWEAARAGHFRFVGSPPATVVRLDAKARPWFEALDEMLVQADADLLDGFDQAGVADVVARRGGVAPPPAAYAGPLKLQVDTVTAALSLKNPGPRTYALGLRLSWAPDVQVVSSGLPILVQAVDPAGKAFVSRSQSPDPYFVRSFGSSRRSTDLTLTIEAGDASAAETVARAEVSLRVRVRHGREEVRFEDLAALPATQAVGPPRGAAGRGGSVTLGSFGPDPDHAGWLLGRLVLVLPPGVAGDTVLPLLEASDGSVRALFDYTSRSVGSDGVMQMTVRAAGLPSGVQPKRITVSWLLREGQGAATFVLKDVPLR